MKETTTTYTWPEGSAIKRIDVRNQKNGFAVAYLYADDREEMRATRTNIRAALRLKGWGTLSDSRNGEFVLRVAALRSGEELISTLQRERFVTSAPQISGQKETGEKSKGLVDEVKSRTLRWSGILATIGNAVSFLEGVLRNVDDNKVRRSKGEKQKLMTGQMALGLAFSAADLPLMFVDEKDDSRQLNLLLKKLNNEYERNGIEIPKNASIYVETSNTGKTFGERAQDFLHDHANKIKCGFEVVASFFSIKAGMEQGNRGKIIAGSIFGPGFLASLLIPEKKIDEEQYAKAGALGKFWMRVQSNPLSVGGLLGYSNTVFTYMSAHDEGQRFHGNRAPKIDKKTGDTITPSRYYKMDYMIPSIMIGANGLYAASKQTVGGDIKSGDMVQDAYRIAAQIINKQPDGEMREKALEATARFFAQRTEISEHYPAARERLVKELDSQRQNPWFELQGLAPYAASKPRTHQDVAPEELAAAHDESKANKVANALADKPITPAAMKPTTTVSAVAQHAHAQTAELARAHN